jgi:calcineurin-like phosphoesterase family protein
VTIWYSADPHWGHRLVAAHRGFADADAHDDWLAGVYIDAFKPGDVVWWLGDLTSRLPVRVAAGMCWATQPDAHHRLIYGNHDAGHPMHREAHRHQGDYHGFKLAAPFAKRKLPKVGEVHLSHFPYTGEGRRDLPERYSQWRLRDLGVPLIHGHTHSDQVVSRSDAGTLQIHVGIDAWKRPVAEHEIVELIRENEGTP